MKEKINIFGEGQLPPAEPPTASARMGRESGSMVSWRLLYFGVTFFVAIFTVFFLFSQLSLSYRADRPGVEETSGTSGRPADSTARPAEESLSPPVSDATPPEESREPIDLYAYDRSLLPAGATAILPMDLSLPAFGASYLHNSTAYRVAEEVLAGEMSFPKVQKNTSLPQILIVHTHGTEAYREGQEAYYYKDGGEYARSHDTAENVVAVGAYMAKLFEEMGIATVHCEVMHDRESYRDSYSRSAESVKAYLQRYPSIQYVIDLHRDWIENADGELVRPIVAVEGEAVAQVMAVIGSDAGGTDHDTWERNLAFAQRLRTELNQFNESFVRPTCLRASSYNQELAPVSILLEMGAGGNSLAEAMTAAKYTAEAIGRIVS